MQSQAPNPNTEYDLLCEVLPQPVVQAAELCALPHSVDDALGYGIIHNFASVDGTARAVWAEVKQLPFVYPYEDKSWQFAESARIYFVARLERRNGTYLALHRYLKERLEADLQRVQNANTPKARELDWRITYHLAALDAQTAVEHLFEMGEQAARTNRLADMRGLLDLFREQQRWLAPFEVERAYFEGRYAYARHDYRTAESCFEFVWEHGRPNLMTAIAGHLLGIIWTRRGGRKWLLKAEEVIRGSLELCRQLGDLYGEAHVLNSLGSVLVELGGRKHFEEAEKLYRRSLVLRPQVGDVHGEAMVLNSLGGVLVRLGGKKKLAEAEKLYRRSLKLLRKLGDRHGEAMVLTSLGGVLVDLGGRKHLEEAEALYRQCLEIERQLDNPRGEAMVLNSLGGALSKLGGQERLEAAESFYRRSLELRHQVGDAYGEAQTLNSLGRVLIKLGTRKRLVETEAVLQRSLELGKKLGRRRHQAMVLTSLADVAEAMGNIPLACQYMQRALAIDESLGSRHASRSRKRLEELRSKLKG